MTFNRLKAFCSSHVKGKIRMQADGTPEDRLEYALDRIAKRLAAPAATAATTVEAGPHPATEEVAERLDRIIATLRNALGK